LDIGDLTIRSRNLLNELTPKFFQDPELWRYMSMAAKEIAQRGSGVRRVLTAITTAATRTVAVNAYKCLHVEFIPASGRTSMLSKIDPLQAGHMVYDGTTEPQYWYEDGANIGLDPIPGAQYNLRLYVSDLPKKLLLTATSFSAGGMGTDTWSFYGTSPPSPGTTLIHTGTLGSAAYNTMLALTTGNLVSVTFTILSCAAGAYAQVNALGYNGNRAYYPGTHTFNFGWQSVNPYPEIAMVGDVVLDNLYIYKEVDFSSALDVSDLPPLWNHTVILAVLERAFRRDSRSAVSKILSSLTDMEVDYLRANIIEIIPDSYKDMKG
jgi:hypothetical protein